MKSVRNLLSITDVSAKEISTLIETARKLKSGNKKSKGLEHKTLLTFFALPSLRTAVSFAVAMHQLGGDVHEYHAEHSPWGKGKENTSDVGLVLSRYVDAVMVRLSDDDAVRELAASCTVPVINGLTNREHPCQVLSDLLTISEMRPLKGLTLCYVGDSRNNVTHSLIFAGALLGFSVRIGCPRSAQYSPDPSVVKEAKRIAKKGFSLTIVSDAKKAASGADVVYTDSWMSYHIPKKEKNKRVKALKSFRVTLAVMKAAKKDALFMHCLPAMRGMEVSAEVIDGSRSVVFDQAENRLHMQKAILLWLIGKR